MKTLCNMGSDLMEVIERRGSRHKLSEKVHHWLVATALLPTLFDDHSHGHMRAVLTEPKSYITSAI